MNNRVEFSDEEIKQMIKPFLTGPHKDLLGEAIISLIGDSDWKKSKLVRAMLGFKDIATHTLHEKYYVKTHNISTYYWDEDAMKEAGMIDQNGCIIVKLLAFDAFQASCYRIEYQYLDKDSQEPKSTTYEVSASELTVVEEFPEDF